MKDKPLYIPDCLRNQTNLISELRDELRLSIPISKIEEVISDLNIGSKEIYSKPIAYRLQKLIDKANNG